MLISFISIVFPFLISTVSGDNRVYKRNWARLRFVPDDISANKTTEVNLAHNKITLLPDDFPEFYLLDTLNFAGNGMEFVEPEAFRNLTNLRTLILNKNALTTIPNLYHVVDSLKELKMQYNSISNITNYTFLHFSALETLDLQNCKISSISSMGLNGLTALKVLVLSGNEISSLHTNVFGGLLSVNSINLDKNSLTDLPSFNSSTLKTLSVEQNKLVTTGNGSFVGAFGLKTLNLKNNELAEWPDLGDAKYGIKTLNLDDSDITNVSQDETESFYKLVTVSLNRNELRELPYFPNSRQTLKYLEANENRIKMIQTSRLDNFTALINFHISNNKLRKFPESRLDSLQVLNLANNLLSRFSRLTMENMPNLKTIDLNNNNLTEFPDFQLCTKLEKIYTSSNRISSDISQHLFGLVYLTELYVSFNKLSTFPNFTYISSDNCSLQILDLSENQISSTTPEYYGVLNNLKQLNIGGNNLEEVPAIVNVSLGSLAILNVSYNNIKR